MSTRRWDILAGGVLLAAVIALAGWRVVAWWTYEPWGELNGVVSTFPVPDGYEQVESREIGDRPAVCDFKMSCHDPALRVEFWRTSGELDACTALQASAREWRKAGFTIDTLDANQEYFPGTDPECVLEGDIAGHGLQMFSPDDARARIAIYLSY
ncbi:MAG TPA: hypothetical protein VFN21_03555 [Acidimicrobiales bacterium]|nr:hypothetical protein [Acidimicrobiales bacterium]